MQEDKSKITVNCVIFGGREVGKTMLCERIRGNDFSERNITTVGADFASVEGSFEQSKYVVILYDVSSLCNTWDIYRKRANMLVFVWDASANNRYGALDCLPKWLTTAEASLGYNDIPVLFVRNKSDLAHSKETTPEELTEIRRLAEQFNINIYEVISTSAKEESDLFKRKLLEFAGKAKIEVKPFFSAGLSRRDKGMSK